VHHPPRKSGAKILRRGVSTSREKLFRSRTDSPNNFLIRYQLHARFDEIECRVGREVECRSSDRHGSCLLRLEMCLSSQISLIVSNFREPFESIYMHEFSERGLWNFSAMLMQFLSGFIPPYKISNGTLPNNIAKISWNVFVTYLNIFLKTEFCYIKLHCCIENF